MDRKNSISNFYMASKTYGGEFFWMERISKKFGSEVSFIWPRDSGKPTVRFSGFKSKIIVTLCKFIPNGRGLFMNLLISKCSFPKGSRAFISTPYYPIPRNTYIAYIQTPSRRLTVDKNLYKPENFIKKTFWKIFSVFYRINYCKSLVNAKYVFANSKNISERVQHMCKLERSLEVLYPTQESEEFKCDGYANYFFCPSRYTEQKNQAFLIEAFSDFYEKLKAINGSQNEYTLILAGSNPKSGPSDENYYANLIEITSHLSDEVRRGIEFVMDKDRKEILEFYSKANVVLYAGRNEDFGFIPVEGMMSCKPVIALNEGGVKETVIDGYNGFLVNTPSEMADKMLLLINDRNLAKLMGENGRKLAAKFDDNTLISRLKALK